MLHKYFFVEKIQNQAQLLMMNRHYFSPINNKFILLNI